MQSSVSGVARREVEPGVGLYCEVVPGENVAVGVRVGPSVVVGLGFAVGTAWAWGVPPLSNKPYRHRVGMLLSIGFGFLLVARRCVMKMSDVRLRPTILTLQCG